MRLTGVAVVVAVALGAVGCGTSQEGAGPLGDGRQAAGEWRRLPQAPLTPRTDAVVVGVGERMLVVGGWTFLCPPGADCDTPDSPLLDDGAVYDRTTDAWSTITAPPFGVRRTEYSAAALDGSAYLLTGCADGPQCDAKLRLLSYDLALDRWTDHGAVPGPRHYRHLSAVGHNLLVYSASDELGETADVVFDPRRSTWDELPDDPMPRTYDRFVVPVGDQLVLTASSHAALESGEESGKLAARLDLARDEWVPLPDAPGAGYQLMPTDHGPLLNGHFIDAPAWLLDPESWSWSQLPGGSGEGHDLRGVLDRDRATYDIPNSVGELASSTGLFVYDSAARALVRIPAPPGRQDVYDDSSTALGRDLFVFGGQRWAGDAFDGEGELVSDPMVWTAP